MLFSLLQFPLRFHRTSREFSESSRFRKFPKYSKFYRIVATLNFLFDLGAHMGETDKQTSKICNAAYDMATYAIKKSKS